MSRSKKYKFLRAPSIVSDHLDHLGTFLHYYMRFHMFSINFIM